MKKLDCKKWIQDCNNGIFKNPETNRKIKKDGPTYNKLMKKCSSKKGVKINDMDKEDCEKWKKSWQKGEMKNPETNRTIKKDGPTYKKIVSQCGSPKKKSKPKSPIKMSDEAVFRKKLKAVTEKEDQIKRIEAILKKLPKDIAEFQSFEENFEYAKKKKKQKLLDYLDVKLKKYA